MARSYRCVSRVPLDDGRPAGCNAAMAKGGDIRAVAGWTPRPGYLNTAAYGLPHPASVLAMRRWLREWEEGSEPFTNWLDATDDAGELFARWIGVPARRVSTGVSASQLIGQLAASLPDGSRVLATRDEFASLLFPLLAQADRGVEVREVPIHEMPDAID